MAKSFRDKRRAKLHRAIKDGTADEMPWLEKRRVTGNLTHNYRQLLKAERRREIRNADKGEVREQTEEMTHEA